MRLYWVVILLVGTAGALSAQDVHSWESLAQLKPGEQVRLTLVKHRPVSGSFQSWASDRVTLANITAEKSDVIRIERYDNRGSGRGKRAAIGALVGFGGGFAIGAAVGGNCSNQVGPCISRGALGGAMGGAGAAVGALIGFALPHHSIDVIYSAQ